MSADVASGRNGSWAGDTLSGLKNLPFSEKLDALNKLWAEVANFKGKLKSFEEMAGLILNIEGQYAGNPFDVGHDYDRVVDEIRERLISKIVDHFERQMNYTIPDSEVTKFLNEKIGIDNFDANVLAQHLQATYARHADELSLQQIKTEASSLVNHRYSDYQKVTTVEDVVKKDKLSLHHWSSWHDDRMYALSELLGKLSALEKLANIVILNENPASTKSICIRSYSRIIEANLLSKNAIGHSVLKFLRIYKNGKVEVECDSEEHAKKLAEALLTGGR